MGGDVALGVDFDDEELEDEWKALVQDIEDGGPTRRLEQLLAPAVVPSATKASEPQRELVLTH
jgi:hypothetical protein